MEHSHFNTRARERGLEGIDLNGLHKDLRIALADPIKWHEYVEYVFPMATGATLWRFRVKPDEFHYAIVRDGRPVTILTAGMVKAYRDVRKGKRFQKL